jgi:hypothetical protein
VADVTKVGGLTLPLPAETVGAQLVDPTVAALLERAAFAIREDLTARFAQIRPENIIDPAPADRLYPFNPLDPRGIKTHIRLPACFAWWEGNSTSKQVTVLRWHRTRMIHFLYVFTELPGQESLTERYGIFNAVDACLFRMSQRQVNPSVESNRTLASVAGGRCSITWRWQGGQQGRFGIDEGPNASRRAKKRSGRDFPALHGMFQAEELVEPRIASDPDDSNIEGLLTINSGEGGKIPILERILEGWDGSDDD